MLTDPAAVNITQGKVKHGLATRRITTHKCTASTTIFQVNPTKPPWLQVYLSAGPKPAFTGRVSTGRTCSVKYQGSRFICSPSVWRSAILSAGVSVSQSVVVRRRHCQAASSSSGVIIGRRRRASLLSGVVVVGCRRRRHQSSSSSNWLWLHSQKTARTLQWDSKQYLLEAHTKIQISWLLWCWLTQTILESWP